MAASPPVSITCLLEEIQDQIISNIPASDLPNVMLATRSFYRLARPYLYRSIHYLKQCLPRDEPHFISFQERSGCSVRFSPHLSAHIIQPHKFLRIIEEQPGLTSLVKNASFAILKRDEVRVVDILKKILDMLRLETLHVRLSGCYSILALTISVTSLDIMYPTEAYLKECQDMESSENNLREEIYALFMMPNLQHLTLREARSWNSFSEIKKDPRRVRSSNLISLSLVDTVPMDSDLEEILTWPKALRCYYHESREGKRRSTFHSGASGRRGVRLPCSKYFLECISAQSGSLEDVFYNHGQDSCGDLGTHFDSALLEEFASLKHLSVPRECFMDLYSQTTVEQIIVSLPPRLEVLRLDETGHIAGSDSEYEARLRLWLWKLSDRKATNFPFLRNVTLVESEYEMREAFDYPEILNLLDRMSLGPEFHEAQIELLLVLEE